MRNLCHILHNYIIWKYLYIYICTYEIYRVEVFQTFQDPKIINIQHYPASPIFLLKKLEAWNNEASNFSFTVGVDVGPCSFGKARDWVVPTLGCLLTVRFLCLVLVLLCGLVLSTQARCSQHVLAEWAYACLLFLCARIQKCETGETFNNWRANFLSPKLQIWNWIKFVEVWVLQRAWNHLIFLLNRTSSPHF